MDNSSLSGNFRPTGEWFCLKCLLPSFEDTYFDEYSSSNVEHFTSSISFDSSPLENVKGLTMAHLNIRSLVKNIDELRQFVCTNNLDVLTLSETWLDSSFSDEEIAIDNFRTERCDRSRPLLIGSVYRPPDDKNFTGLNYFRYIDFENYF